MKNTIQKHFEDQGWEITSNGHLKPGIEMLTRLNLTHMKSWNKLLKGELEIDALQLQSISREFAIPMDKILEPEI